MMFLIEETMLLAVIEICYRRSIHKFLDQLCCTPLGIILALLLHNTPPF